MTAAFWTLTSAPIVMCSARHDHIDHELGVTLGTANFRGKTVELDELEERVEAVLRRSHNADESQIRQRRRGDRRVGIGGRGASDSK